MTKRNYKTLDELSKKDQKKVVNLISNAVSLLMRAEILKPLKSLSPKDDSKVRRNTLSKKGSKTKLKDGRL